MNNGVAAMLGRPDLASTYGVYQAAPVAGQVPASGATVLSGNLTTSVAGNVGTGQLSLGMVAALIVLMFLIYYWTRQYQH